MLTDVDKGNDDRTNPRPNTHDLFSDTQRMAHGTISTSYVTTGSSTVVSRLVLRNNQIIGYDSSGNQAVIINPDSLTSISDTADDVQLAGDLGNTLTLPYVINTHLNSPLPTNQGGSGTTVVTGSGSLVLNSSPTMVTPIFDAYMSVDGVAASARSVFYSTSGSNRIELQVTNTAESGSNVGSNFAINTYDDSGSYLSSPFIVTRKTGFINIYDGVSLGGSVQVPTGGGASSAGTGQLSGGTVTISTTAVTSSSLIFLTDTVSSFTNVGTLSVASKIANTSFTVKSSNVLDASTFNWLIIN